eukprot:Skav226695  [mRNA]  locus=scaffold3971:189447:199470:- [translate_table: standard]
MLLRGKKKTEDGGQGYSLLQISEVSVCSILCRFIRRFLAFSSVTGQSETFGASEARASTLMMKQRLLKPGGRFLSYEILATRHEEIRRNKADILKTMMIRDVNTIFWISSCSGPLQDIGAGPDANPWYTCFTNGVYQILAETMEMRYKVEVGEEMPDKRMMKQGLADTGPAKHSGEEPRHPVERLLTDHLRRDDEQSPSIWPACSDPCKDGARTTFPISTSAWSAFLDGALEAKPWKFRFRSFEPSTQVGLETVLDMDDTIEFEDIMNLEARLKSSP